MTELPTESATTTVEAAASAPEPRPGVPVWRVGKPDAFLADAVSTARAAVREIAANDNIGKHVAARSEGVRVVTHLFECLLPGYVGWQWFATVTRVSRSKDVTVNEVGMLPTNDSVLAPPWVPWAERVRPEDATPDEPVEPEHHDEPEHDDEDHEEPGHDDDDDASETDSEPAED
ncbi:hypothetical protein AL755_04705 [Arthrobacter sp. ERGS1:01]|uniref:DUF3027 domain-containing protein n=1 Tax=Arthrobacter sp. ERGS1:01 TaxID=1704044 RepID=UPI0006B4528B|nr:DUF3027 domain-containing protein [Arthrobacter sp. ERGS1:01]ALE07562.1 hypothetical protein AL755_04705 [Arthrobacter sp. ERGS1:01]